MEKNKCKECGHEIPEKKGIAIVSRYDDTKVLFQSTKDTMKEAVEEAVEGGSNLIGSNLNDSDLRCSNLSYSDLSGSNLSYSDLRGSDLSGSKTTRCVVNFIASEYDQAKQFIEGLKL